MIPQHQLRCGNKPNRNLTSDSLVADSSPYHRILPELESVDPRPTYSFLGPSIPGNLMIVLADR